MSPSEGQVDYALLTRSPLRLIEASFHRSSFDLHVLSTPPAFVLSQDQTLQKNMKNQKKLAQKTLVDKEINKKNPPTNNTFVGEEFKT